jgi:hypothetical protein
MTEGRFKVFGIRPVTLDQVLAWEPCSRPRVRYLFMGRECLMATQTQPETGEFMGDPRNSPCPTSGAANVLTSLDRAHGDSSAVRAAGTIGGDY